MCINDPYFRFDRTNGLARLLLLERLRTPEARVEFKNKHYQRQMLKYVLYLLVHFESDYHSIAIARNEDLCGIDLTASLEMILSPYVENQKVEQWHVCSDCVFRKLYFS